METKNVPPTCAEKGRIERTCSVCGDVQTEEVDVTEHDYEETGTAEPTCTESGYIEKTCKRCKYVARVNNGAPKGHTGGEWEVVKEAALGVVGERVQKCTECGGTARTEVIPMIMSDGTDNVYFVDLGGGEEFMVIGHFDEEAETQIENLVNSHRSSIGVGELARHEDYDEMADIRAIETVYLPKHSRPNGVAMRCGENLISAGSKYSGPALHEAWMNSDGHRKNIEKATTTRFGVSVFHHIIKTTASGKKTYGTTSIEVFGKYSMLFYHDDSLWGE